MTDEQRFFAFCLALCLIALIALSPFICILFFFVVLL